MTVITIDFKLLESRNHAFFILQPSSCSVVPDAGNTNINKKHGQ